MSENHAFLSFLEYIELKLGDACVASYVCAALTFAASRAIKGRSIRTDGPE